MAKAAERTERARLLVVEDDDAYRRFLVAELGDFGFPVEGVGDGNAAIAAVEATAPAVVLLDIRLPGLRFAGNGRAHVRQARSQANAPRCRCPA